MRFGRLVTPLTAQQWCIWLASLGCILAGGAIGHMDALTMAASLLGATSLIFTAKRNLLGPLGMIVFSVLYGIISFRQTYFGEMITYLGMTLPMSVVCLVSWMKHPASSGSGEVEIGSVGRSDVVLLCISAAGVTMALYWVLRFLHNANLTLSTVSVTTSYVAAFLTWKRSPWYGAAYAVNDLVLVALWTMAALKEDMYWALVICFGVFFVNDLYGFGAWMQAARSQRST